MADLAATVDLLQVVGEPTRVRLLALLADQELTVADLTAITELGQSRVSTHLARLREAGLVADRRNGTATFYSLNERAMPAGARRVWSFLHGEVRDAQLDRDRQRREALLRARTRAGWPDALAGQMERHYSPGRTWESLARGLAGLVALGDALDAGAGDGSIAELLAPRARSYTLVDRSPRMIAAAALRLSKRPNVRASIADVHALPFPAAAFDTVLSFNVLPELERPDAALVEARRVLRPGGRLAIIALDAHEHAELAAAWKHRHLGFAPAALRRALARAGFTIEGCAVTSREKRPPRFRVVTAFARRKP